MKAEIISVGTELLVGEIVNTNAQYISQKLKEIGVDLYFQTTVGDNFERLKDCLNIAYSRVDLVITTGGLGPTLDDITKEVVANYFDVELEVVPKYLNMIQQAYEKKGWAKLPLGAEKEASILKDSKILHNEVGLAPGFLFEKDGKKIIVLPGPPKELTYMMDNKVIPILKEYSNMILLSKTLEIKGVPEGIIDDRLAYYFKMSNPTVAPYAKEGSVHVRVAMKGKEIEKDYVLLKINDIINQIKEIYPMAEEINY